MRTPAFVLAPSLLTAFLLCLSIASGTHAEIPDATERASTHFGVGKKRLGVSIGYGLGFAPSKDVSLVEVIPSFGIGVLDLGSVDAWYRGNMELLVQGSLAFNTHPHFGYAIGGGVALRYNFLAAGRIVPYMDGGFGVVHMDFDRLGQSDGLNFNSGAGAGFHWFVAERWSLSPEIRWQHYSNADLRLPNEGINAVLFLLGASYFFD